MFLYHITAGVAGKLSSSEAKQLLKELRKKKSRNMPQSHMIAAN